MKTLHFTNFFSVTAATVQSAPIIAFAARWWTGRNSTGLATCWTGSTCLPCFGGVWRACLRMQKSRLVFVRSVCTYSPLDVQWLLSTYLLNRKVTAQLIEGILEEYRIMAFFDKLYAFIRNKQLLYFNWLLVSLVINCDFFLPRPTWLSKKYSAQWLWWNSNRSSDCLAGAWPLSISWPFPLNLHSNSCCP